MHFKQSAVFFRTPTLPENAFFGNWSCSDESSEDSITVLTSLVLPGNQSASEACSQCVQTLLLKVMVKIHGNLISRANTLHSVVGADCIQVRLERTQMHLSCMAHLIS